MSRRMSMFDIDKFCENQNVTYKKMVTMQVMTHLLVGKCVIHNMYKRRNLVQV